MFKLILKIFLLLQISINFNVVLTRSQYEIMSKEELIQELIDINSSFVNDINIKLSNLEEKFNDFLSKYDNVNSDFQQYKKLTPIYWQE